MENKKYPPKPTYIIGNQCEQLWIVLPVCILLIFCNGVGILGSIFLFIIWLMKAGMQSQIEWIRACQNGYATVYSSQEYLAKYGFYEEHMVGLRLLSEIKKEKEDMEEHIRQLKEEFENLIIKVHNNPDETVQEWLYREELYRTIMKYYGIKYIVIPNNAYEILIQGGNLYKIKYYDDEHKIISQDFDYYKKFGGRI